MAASSVNCASISNHGSLSLTNWDTCPSTNRVPIYSSRYHQPKVRYEYGAIIITSNRAYKHWPEIFNNHSTLTSALLDRLLYHAETVLIEGKSHRMKDQIEA